MTCGLVNSNAWYDEVENEKERNVDIIPDEKKQKANGDIERELKIKNDEDKLFRKIRKYLKDPHSGCGIFTLKKLSELHSSTPAENLDKLASIICTEMFNTPVKKVKVDYLVHFYQDFSYLKATTNYNSKQTVRFGEILARNFIDKLAERLSYEKRLSQLVNNRPIPADKKVEWVKRCSDQQRTYLKQTDGKSIIFLAKLFKWDPEIVYKSLELLLQLDSSDSVDYMNSLLKALDSNAKIDDQHSICSLSRMIYVRDCISSLKLHDWSTSADDEALEKLFVDVTKQAGDKVSTPKWQSTQTLLKIFMRNSPSKPVKYHYPEDYIKRRVQNVMECGMRLKDDFEEDSEIEDVLPEWSTTNYDSDGFYGKETWYWE